MDVLNNTAYHARTASITSLSANDVWQSIGAIPSEAYAVAAVACLSCLFTVLANVFTSKNSDDARGKAVYSILGFLRDIVAVTARFLVYSFAATPGNVIARCVQTGLLLWPVSVFEITTQQLNTDLLTKRNYVWPNFHYALQCLSVCVLEGAAVALAFRYLPLIDMSSPITAASLASTVLLCPVFDLGLDLGFYAFHRMCHINKKLYKLVHRDHHVDTAEDHGRLVAYETYTITVYETAFIISSYFLGMGALLGVRWALYGSLELLSIFEVAFLVTWGHTLETLGHTSVSSTPKYSPQRVVLELLGLDLQVNDHTMHHKMPLSNFSKRMTLWDRVFGTYSPRDEKVVYNNGDEYRINKKLH